MSIKCEDILGLILNMTGVALLFFFGFPQPNHEQGVSLAVSENTVLKDGTKVKDILASQKRRKKLYKTLSYIALILLFLGFLLQLLSVVRNK